MSPGNIRQWHGMMTVTINSFLFWNRVSLWSPYLLWTHGESPVSACWDDWWTLPYLVNITVFFLWLSIKFVTLIFFLHLIFFSIGNLSFKTYYQSFLFFFNSWTITHVFVRCFLRRFLLIILKGSWVCGLGFLILQSSTSISMIISNFLSWTSVTHQTLGIIL